MPPEARGDVWRAATEAERRAWYASSAEWWPGEVCSEKRQQELARSREVWHVGEAACARRRCRIKKYGRSRREGASKRVRAKKHPHPARPSQRGRWQSTREPVRCAAECESPLRVFLSYRQKALGLSTQKPGTYGNVSAASVGVRASSPQGLIVPFSTATLFLKRCSIDLRFSNSCFDTPKMAS